MSRKPFTNVLYQPEFISDPEFVSPERQDARFVFETYCNHTQRNLTCIDFPKDGIVQRLGSGKRYHEAMLEIEKNASHDEVTVCWFYCLVSLPEWHFTVRQAQVQVHNNQESGITPSTVLNSQIVDVIKLNIIKYRGTNITIPTRDMLDTFKCALIAKVKTATRAKIFEFRKSFKQINYEEFTSDSSEVAFQRIMDSLGKLAALMMNFIQSPDNTLKNLFEYRTGTGVKLHIAGNRCSPAGCIFYPSENDPSKKRFIIKTWELKHPYISNDMKTVANMSDSKMLFRQLIPHCLAARSILVLMVRLFSTTFKR
ncbi:unnamed protein product [Ambrosiozyma monospora]|uniref:Unnamed protein product n=1 Tax=Ambrosiozyma monospora TaxID=43982 RepID=A0A9W6SWZ6_AMBMO|nr:unnamed protein product [Ambrosiozyma monospora]